MKDVREMRELLRSMQSGEMTVSRGMELLDLWLAGNYRDDMLPPVREGLGEDETPWDRIDTLTQQRDELLAALKLWKLASDNAEESELDDMACYCVPMPLFCDADEATEAAIAKVKEQK